MGEQDKRQPVGVIRDRSGALTEQRNPRTLRLDELSVRACVELLNDEDATVARAVRSAAPSIAAFIEDLERRWRDGGRLIYIGAGTSGRLGVLDASECPPTFQTPPERIVGIIAGGDAALQRSSEGAEDDPDGAAKVLDALGVNDRDTALGVAAGGTTPYVLGALAICRARGAMTGLLTCSPSSEPAPADHLILIETGPEPVTGSTRMKAGTATKMALNTISTTLMVRAGKVHENLMVDLRASNAKLIDRAIRIVQELTGLSRAEAHETLNLAGGSVKTALLMTLCELTRDQAEARLDRAGGVLRRAMSEGDAP